MKEADLVLRLDRFERTVATCVGTVPLFFSAQCLFASLSCPVFADMFKENGAKLPGPTQFVIGTWQIWALVAVAGPIMTLMMARKGKPTFSVVFSTVAGIAIFLVAQFVTVALFLPIFELAAVAGGLK
jgi:hypothetical protein